MTDLNLPPLERAAVFTDHSGSFFHPRAYVANSVEARERIMLARIAELGEDIDYWINSNTTQAHQLNAAMARIARLEADAARYRWLKDRLIVEEIIVCARYENCGEQAAVEAAIDAAREAKP